MNLKHLTFAAVGVMTLAACTSEELVENKASDEITFNVTAAKPSRASQIYDGTNKSFTQMLVTAKNTSDDLTYFSNDIYEKAEAAATWKGTGETHYWPAFALDFYACVPASIGNAFVAEGPSDNKAPVINGFTVAPDAKDQVDLLVAYAGDVNKTSLTSGQVTLNFRHALSQVVFKAQNKNKGLYAEVYGLTVCNVSGSGTFIYPVPTADVNSNTATSVLNNVDNWGSRPAVNSDFEVSFAQVRLRGGEAAVSLTDGVRDNTLMMIPQTQTNTAQPGALKAGSYILVKCKLFNVANAGEGGGYQSTDTQIWPKDGEKDTDGTLVAKNILVPVNFTWEPGKKYIYTLIFGEGNNGYDPDDQTAVTNEIEFVVTVDDWTDEALDVDVNGTPQTPSTNP